MALKLAKGGKLKLTKDGVSLSNIRLDLSWGAKVFDSQKDFDLDLTLFLLSPDAKLPFGRGREDWTAYYGQTVLCGGAVKHSGDERTGKKEGVDEYVKIALDKLPPEVTSAHAVVTIHEAVERGQNFGGVRESKCALVDEDTGDVLVEVDLTNTPALAVATATLFVELNKGADGNWTFGNVSEGFNKGLGEFMSIYGIESE